MNLFPKQCWVEKVAVKKCIYCDKTHIKYKNMKMPAVIYRYTHTCNETILKCMRMMNTKFYSYHCSEQEKKGTEEEDMATSILFVMFYLLNWVVGI